MNNLRTGILLLIVQMIIVCSINSQKIAVTEDSDTIFIYNDGTWSYDLIEDYDSEVIQLFRNSFNVDTTDFVFIKPDHADKEYSSKKFPAKVNINSKDWKRVPEGSINQDAEFAFQSKNADIFSILISEEIEIGTENIFGIALDNIENSGAKILNVEAMLVEVNGINLLNGIMHVEISGAKFTFDSYYYSDERGTVQYTTWTGSSLYPKYQAKMKELLNGLEL